jgi:hypothetical protein
VIRGVTSQFRVGDPDMAGDDIAAREGFVERRDRPVGRE